MQRIQKTRAQALIIFGMRELVSKRTPATAKEASGTKTAPQTATAIARGAALQPSSERADRAVSSKNLSRNVKSLDSAAIRNAVIALAPRAPTAMNVIAMSFSAILLRLTAKNARRLPNCFKESCG